MKPLTVALLVFFGLILAIDCFFILHHLEQGRIFTKSLLMPLLLVVLNTEAAKTRHKRSRLYLNGALIFCFAGDLLLLVENDPTYFIAGLSCFLVAHIFYMSFFLRIKPIDKKKVLFTFISGAVIFGYAIFLLSEIWLEVGKQDLEMPVIIYALAISGMLLGAVNTLSGRRARKLGLMHFVPGALLFVASDSVLAINKFSLPVANADILIIVSYAIAQVLIITGGIRILKN